LVGVPAALGAHATNCSRIQVETVDRGVTLNSYAVRDSEYVATRRAEIEANGEDGAWTVSASELGLAAYTFTYSCLPSAPARHPSAEAGMLDRRQHQAHCASVERWQ